ncbi:energy-coupling factor transporter transmembrane component T family protein [Natranaerobius thermophilus]|uniref:Cobalt transport protein n=1 Tax=Natranaerobius thermophilus (strain ATCC BAA-1301 / DSM 18059 / JW/NM-WN-LF) TaxID=457570 RepID=B2A5A0_NATTJ|nr:energy-coupling factor transporter transmembrane component T [Natranaerobius thermophilus]ACB83934.1 cobalt transport protein [Natranaerobius thermophilus JW/NM-WN-LF]
MTHEQVQNNQYDPRTKLFIVMCLSSLAVFLEDLVLMTGVLIVALGISFYFQSEVLKAIYKLRKFLWIFVAMVFIQSIFTSGGEELFSIGDITVLSSLGVTRGISIILRIMIILVSATIMGTSSSRDIVQGLYQWKIPYELAFMVAIAIRFLPLLKEEAVDIITAIQLRGLELEKVPWGKKIKIYSYLIMPMISSVIVKSRELAIAVEMRGFRAYPTRTSYRVLHLSIKDYAVMFSAGLITAAILSIYFGDFINLAG